jgi:MATE family multidrug resistance protein
LKRIAHSIFLLIILFDVVFCLIFLITNNYLPLIYLDFDNPLNYDDSLEVLLLASKLIIISAFFQIFDGLQAVALGALRGLQDVNIPAWITFFSYGVFGIPLSFYLGIYTDLGVIGIWIGLLSGLFASCILLLSRFQYLIKKLIN